MDFSIIYQLRTKKFWWLDVVFYFVISLLVATLFCYLIFSIKISMQQSQIRAIEVSMETVGTDQQKVYEKEVLSYQKKFNDFANLFKNHEFTSNVFAFVEEHTRPTVWFQRFNLNQKEAQVVLSGESDNMEEFGRQVAVLEKNEYVKSVSLLNSTVSESSRVAFNLNLALKPEIFSYILSSTFNQTPVVETVSPSSEPVTQPGQKEKLITLFNLPLIPEVVGAIDQTNYTVVLNVPFGTDVTKLAPVVNVSTGALVSPDSGAVQDFTNPATYQVIAEDSTVQNYTVTVNILPEDKTKANNSIKVVIIIIVFIVIITAGAVAAFIFIKKKKKDKEEEVK